MEPTTDTTKTQTADPVKAQDGGEKKLYLDEVTGEMVSKK